MHYPHTISYDHGLKVLTISPSAWTATGPVRWFDAYRIISIIDNPIADRVGVINLRDYVREGETFQRSIEHTYTSDLYKRMLRELKMEDFFYVADRPAPYLNEGTSVLVNDYQTSRQYENKVWFREKFADDLQFADFKLVSLSDLKKKEVADELFSVFNSSFVIQHAQLGGGRGTFLISDETSFKNCIEALAVVTNDPTERVVISRRLTNAKERSVQACVTSEGVLVGPAQSQLVRHPLLVSSFAGDMQFCGGRIHEDLVSDQQYQAIEKSAIIVGEELRNSGYRGIFGVDFMVNDEGVYVLEANPRLTGLTPLLAFLQNEVPFLLLHILELAHSPYKILSNNNMKLESGSFVELYAQEDGTINFQSGVYNQQLELVSKGFESGTMLPESTQDFFVGMRVNAGSTVKRGKAICFVYSKRQLFNDDSLLSPSAEVFITRLREKFTPL